MVSNHFQQAVRNLEDDWPLRPGTVHPAHLAGPLAEMRIHPAELENAHILPFIPRAAEIDQTKDKRMEACAKVIAEISGIHAAATACMQLEPWEFMGVYYDGIDHFGHGFMKYHPPRQPWVPEEDFEFYKEVIEAGYRYHDMMLDTLLQIAGDDTTVMLISDHGFEPGNLRPQNLPNEPAGPAAEHSQYGIFCLRGPGIKAGERIHGADLLDITPTLLHLYGLPVGRDMDGKVLVNCFTEEQHPAFVDSWDSIAGDHPDGQHARDTQIDPTEARESIKQLIDLGYIDEPNPDRAAAIEETVRELDYNLAQAYMDASQSAEAARILERLWDRWPEESRFGVRLISCVLNLQEPARARSIYDQLISRVDEHAPKATKKIEEIIAELKAKAEKDGQEFKPEAIDQAAQQRLRRLHGQTKTNPRALAFHLANVQQAEERYAEALTTLGKAAGAEASLQPSYLAKQGELQRLVRDWPAATETYRQLIEIDPRNPVGHFGLATCELALKRPFEAAAHARQALEYNFHHPQARYVYAKALLRLNQPKFAEQVLLAAVAEMPRFANAHAMLAMIYRRALKNPTAADRHSTLARESAQANRANRHGLSTSADASPTLVADFPSMVPLANRIGTGITPLIVVSGLPRSGTSLMMQMLAAGGITPVTDHNREADESNRKGYYEDDRVKKLITAKDRSWLNNETGKVIKIVAPLLHSVPEDIALKIIFMERDASEVIASQRKMLERDKKAGARTDDAALARTFAAQLRAAQAFAEKRENVELLPISYAETIIDPSATAKAVAEFLGSQLDQVAMAAAADPILYRTGRT